MFEDVISNGLTSESKDSSVVFRFLARRGRASITVMLQVEYHSLPWAHQHTSSINSLFKLHLQRTLFRNQK